GPVIPELPTIVVAHGSVPQTIRLRLRDRCEEIVGTAMVRLDHRSPAVGQIRGPVQVDPMRTHRASPTVGQRDGSRNAVNTLKGSEAIVERVLLLQSDDHPA